MFVECVEKNERERKENERSPKHKMTITETNEDIGPLENSHREKCFSIFAIQI